MTPYHFCYVYVLQSVRFARQLYIGYTSDLRKRLTQHNDGKSRFSTRFKPCRLVYDEAFLNPETARAREMSLKHNGNPMRELKKRIGISVGAKVVRGFTLIETLVAVSLLAIAITAPMTLVSKSLATAYYARDQIIAFHLAQEAIETVRHLRDHNVLLIAQGDISADLLANIPVGQRFIIDTLNDRVWTEDEWGACPPGEAPLLKTDGTFYGHGGFPCDTTEPGWTPTQFRRYAEAEVVALDENEVSQEIRISVTVSWQPSVFRAPREIIISENLYRWVRDGSVQQ